MQKCKNQTLAPISVPEFGIFITQNAPSDHFIDLIRFENAFRSRKRFTSSNRTSDETKETRKKAHHKTVRSIGRMTFEIPPRQKVMLMKLTTDCFCSGQNVIHFESRNVKTHFEDVKNTIMYKIAL